MERLLERAPEKSKFTPKGDQVILLDGTTTTLEYAPGDDRGTWIVVLGEPGTGKSETILKGLQAILDEKNIFSHVYQLKVSSLKQGAQWFGAYETKTRYLQKLIKAYPILTGGYRLTIVADEGHAVFEKGEEDALSSMLKTLFEEVGFNMIYISTPAMGEWFSTFAHNNPAYKSRIIRYFYLGNLSDDELWDVIVNRVKEISFKYGVDQNDLIGMIASDRDYLVNGIRTRGEDFSVRMIGNNIELVYAKKHYSVHKGKVNDLLYKLNASIKRKLQLTENITPVTLRPRMTGGKTERLEVVLDQSISENSKQLITVETQIIDMLNEQLRLREDLMTLGKEVFVIDMRIESLYAVEGARSTTDFAAIRLKLETDPNKSGVFRQLELLENLRQQAVIRLDEARKQQQSHFKKAVEAIKGDNGALGETEFLQKQILEIFYDINPDGSLSIQKVSVSVGKGRTGNSILQEQIEIDLGNRNQNSYQQNKGKEGGNSGGSTLWVPED